MKEASGVLWGYVCLVWFSFFLVVWFQTFVCLFIHFILYFLKVFRNVPCSSSEQSLSVSPANAFSGSTQISYRTGG